MGKSEKYKLHVLKRIMALLIVSQVFAACGVKGPPVAPERRLPEVVGDLSGTVEGSRVVLEWTNPEKRVDQSRMKDLTAVRIYRREETPDGPPKPALISWGQVVGYNQITEIKLAAPASAQVEGRRVRWADESVALERRYVYVVTAVDSIGRMSPPSNRLVMITIPASTPPEGLVAKAGDGQVALSWKAPALTIDGHPLRGALAYQLLRATTSSGPFQPVGEPSTALSTTDSGLQNDQPYYYVVRAIRSEQSSRALSEPSSTVTATPLDLTPPAPPKNLVAFPLEAAVRLAWDANPDADLAGYLVYRAPAPRGEFVRITSEAVTTPVFVDRSVERGKEYRYAVSAIDRARRPNESQRSAEVSITVP